MKTIRSGFSIVELLIVIAIVTLLLQLMIPAVQSSREAARQTVCQNNLRQIGLACQSHVSATGRLPAGGWDFTWAGDPDRGNDRRQPGGWIYNILPYIEQQELHELGAGQDAETKKEQAAKMCRTPLELFICPSRRRATLYPYWQFNTLPMKNTSYLEYSSKTDYAACAGDYYSSGFPGPNSLAEGDSPEFPWDHPDDPEQMPSLSTGVVFQRSEITPKHITDGLTSTYLAGEKYLRIDRYTTGIDGGDDQTLFGGFDEDVNRWTYMHNEEWVPPLGDLPGATTWKEGFRNPLRYRFGGPHVGGCNFVFCDGSVRTISFSIDGELHRYLGNRKDGVAAQIPDL